MIDLVIFTQAVTQSIAPGIPEPIPATRFSCELSAADGTHFTVAGLTPRFPKGWDYNRADYVELRSSHPEAFQRKVGIDPGPATDWFRDFQVSSGYPGVTEYTLQLKLRKDGASVGYVTRYRSTGERVPYEYYAAGLCKADFAPAGTAAQERGQ